MVLLQIQIQEIRFSYVNNENTFQPFGEEIGDEIYHYSQLKPNYLHASLSLDH
jgi:hypothetical protein